MKTSEIYSQLLGREIQLHAYLPNLRNHVIRHDDFRLSISPADQNNKIDSSFIVGPALNGSSGVSFQSRNYPDRYIRHRDKECFIEVPSKNELNDFSWEPEFGPSTANTGNMIPVSFNSNGWYMMHYDFDVNVLREASDTKFKDVATWLINKKQPGEGIQASGRWQLLNSYDGQTDWTFDKVLTVGIRKDESSSTTKTDTTGWKISRESEMSAYGATAKMAFELSGQHSISNMIGSAISQSREEKTAQSYAGGPSKNNTKSTWLWQWVVEAEIPNVMKFSAYLPIVQATNSETAPPPPQF